MAQGVKRTRLSEVPPPPNERTKAPSQHRRSTAIYYYYIVCSEKEGGPFATCIPSYYIPPTQIRYYMALWLLFWSREKMRFLQPCSASESLHRVGTLMEFQAMYEKDENMKKM